MFSKWLISHQNKEHIINQTNTNPFRIRHARKKKLSIHCVPKQKLKGGFTNDQNGVKELWKNVNLHQQTMKLFQTHLWGPNLIKHLDIIMCELYFFYSVKMQGKVALV